MKNIQENKSFHVSKQILLHIYIVNGKICSSRLAKQDFLYIDDINFWGGGFKMAKEQ